MSTAPRLIRVIAAISDCYRKYDILLDPLWSRESEQKAERFIKDEIPFYQCDHLGTQQELTDHNGKGAWSAKYKGRGETKEAIGEAAYKPGMRNPIRWNTNT